MPPRVSLRKVCFILLFLVVVSLLVSLQDGFSWYAAAKYSWKQNQVVPEEENLYKTAPSIVISQQIVIAQEDPVIFRNDIPKEETYENPPETTIQKGKSWFFKGGTEYPENHVGKLKLFPDQLDGDRIEEQLMYVPEDYQDYETPEKLILVYNGLGTWAQKTGSVAFHGCPVNRCSLTDDRNRAQNADAILYKDHFIHPGIIRPRNQIWIMYFLECPYHTQSIRFSNLINWTATYRRDSDLVAPYERWTYYDSKVRQKVQTRDYAANRTKKVAWFVSNCSARNGRLAYARELGKHIPVDIYGTCGPLKCPRTDKKCFEILEKEYKFYLAFENSNCRDYITEKFYVNGLGHNVLPIVMGARPEDYQRSAPEGSYIHVDEFSSPRELAQYLHRLDKDNDLYNSYFKWKGTGEFINTYFWCRLCAMMHTPFSYRHYEDVNEWWRGTGVCSSKSWRSSDNG